MTLSDPILVAVDLKPGFERTVDEARQVGAATGAALTLVHAVPVPTMPQFGDDIEGDRNRAEARCRELLTELAGAGVQVSPDPVVKIEEPRDLIVETARAHPTSLVILGDGGKAKLDRILFGAIAEKVLRESPRPVWVVHPRKGPGIDKVLVAVDTSHAAGEALKLGAALARLLGARVDLLRIFPETGPRLAVEARHAELRTYASEFDLAGVEVELVTWEGQPGKRIVDAATEREADLLVLGTAGRRGLYRWLKQPMGEQVVRRLPCSLLCVQAIT